MTKLKLTFLLVCLLGNLTYSQDSQLLTYLTIPEKLLEHANAVVRLNEMIVDYQDVKSITFKKRRIVTILNKEGNKNLDAYAYYDNSRKIKKISAVVYDQLGEEIEKFKNSDFQDVSAVSDFSLYEDDRVKYLNYTPTTYPYTVEFNYEIITDNSAYIPFWAPMDGYYMSVEHSSIEILHNPSLEVKFKEYNLEGYNITQDKGDSRIYYEVTNAPSIQPEQYSPRFLDIIPLVRFQPTKFHYEGFYGDTTNWQELGKWMYDELLDEGFEVSEKTKSKILELTDGKTTLEKARIVYDFVQQNTRYISVQEGIGGIRPIPAMKVDEVKYGDCKGLTNYTKALMDLVGIESYYTVVYASEDNTVNIDEDFVTLMGQANHVILNIPDEKEDVWLECTSQTSPFNYIAGFTDDRNVWVVTPDGGHIKHTRIYDTSMNLQKTDSKVKLDGAGAVQGSVEISSSGYQYTLHDQVALYNEKEKEIYYKKYWSNLNNVKLNSINFHNDKDQIRFVETVDLNIDSYASKAGDRLILMPNLFNVVEDAPVRYRNRQHQIAVDRGFVDEDESIIEIDESLEVEALFNETKIENKFGAYVISIEEIEPNKLLFKRKYQLNKGRYPKEDYEEFRTFISTVVKNDKSKIALRHKSK